MKKIYEEPNLEIILLELSNSINVESSGTGGIMDTVGDQTDKNKDWNF